MITATAGSAALTFVLGLRHGLDADHLAAIDSLTRWNSDARRPFAPWCGLLFTAGHSAVIVIASLSFTYAAGHLDAPDWLGPLGALISALTLIFLGAINLRLASTARAHRASTAAGLRTALFSRLLRAPHWWQVASLGALFAVSFDAIAVALLFAATPLPMANGAGLGAAALGAGTLALAFASGMLLVGTVNGLWVMRLLRRSGGSSAEASRIFTLAIALAGFTVGIAALLPLVSGPMERWLADHELAVSAFVITAVVAGYFAALVHSGRTRFTRHTPTLS